MNFPTTATKRVVTPTLDLASVLDFDLPQLLEASEPPEARGRACDQVRLMVSCRSDNRCIHTQFSCIDEFLKPGDLLVINTSGTLNAALAAIRADGSSLELHLSTHLPADLWVVEARQPAESGTQPFFAIQPPETLRLPDGGSATIHVPYRSIQRKQDNAPVRLWIATLDLPMPHEAYLAAHGFPIRYNYVKREWPNSYYQTVYATEMGSAEMPSAGRAFTPQLITKLVANGVQIAPLILHTGVASLEDHEPPYAEYYRVSATTAQAVNNRTRGGRARDRSGDNCCTRARDSNRRAGSCLPRRRLDATDNHA